MERKYTEKELKIIELLETQDLFELKSIEDVNHSPHAYTIGSRHIVHASENSNGILGEDTMSAVPCAVPKCVLSYIEHTFDKVCFLQQIRDGTSAEASIILKYLVNNLDTNFVDGFGFVETPEKYRIINIEVKK